MIVCAPNTSLSLSPSLPLPLHMTRMDISINKMKQAYA